MKYALSFGTSFCQIGDTVIFLNIVADRYFGLSGAAAASFLKLLDHSALLDADRTHLLQLVHRHILIERPEDSAEISMVRATPPKPSSRLLDGKLSKSAPLQTVGALIVLWRSELLLRVTSLHAVLGTLQRLKARKRLSRASPDSVQLLLQAFERTELIVSPHNKCLPRSIAIARAILSRGIAVDLVLGVKLRPFRAHCWVQAEDRLVNDSLDRVRDFTPILVI